MKKLLSIILCFILCFSMFSCNKEKPAETTATTSGTEDTELITAPLVNSDGIMSMVIVGEGNENREDKVTGTVILGPLRGEESGYRDYTIEYYNPNDAEYIKTVTDYINSHKLKLLEESPVILQRPVNFTIEYFNGNTVFVKGREQFLGICNTNNGEYTWYEMQEDTVITPQAFFETIERPPQPTTPEDSTVSTDQNAVRLSVPLVDGKIVFPDKDIEHITVSQKHYSSTTSDILYNNEIRYEYPSTIKSIKNAFADIKAQDIPEDYVYLTFNSPYDFRFYFSDNTYIEITVPNRKCLYINGKYYMPEILSQTAEIVNTVQMIFPYRSLKEQASIKDDKIIFNDTVTEISVFRYYYSGDKGLNTAKISTTNSINKFIDVFNDIELLPSAQSENIFDGEINYTEFRIEFGIDTFTSIKFGCVNNKAYLKIDDTYYEIDSMDKEALNTLIAFD